MKNMLNFKNFSAEELMEILTIAQEMKKDPEKYAHSLDGKMLYTLFEKTSTRTFLSFQQESRSLADITSTSFGRIRILFSASRFLRSVMCVET